jgi:uncharacterized protein (DUF433 family)
MADFEPQVVQHVELRENRRGVQRAYIAGTRIRIQDIATYHDCHGMSAEEIAREFAHLTLAQVYAALAYYFDNRELVRSHMKEDDHYAESMRSRLNATTLSETRKVTDADGNQVSS